MSTSECDVPECVNGYIRVPVIEERVSYGQGYRVVSMEDVPCARCFR